MPYEIFDPKVDGPLEKLSRKDAKFAYEWYMENLEERIRQLGSYVAERSIELDFIIDSLEALQDWFYEEASKDKILGLGDLSPKLLSICVDIGIYFSEMLIQNTKSLKWKFFIGVKRHIHHQYPVITGFNVPNKEFHVFIEGLVWRYANRILGGAEKEENFLTEIYDACVADAH